MLFTEDLFGPRAKQADLFEDVAVEESTPTTTKEATMATIPNLTGVTYSGSIWTEPTRGYVVSYDAGRGRYTLKVRKPYECPWGQWVTLRNVRPTSITPVTKGDRYGTEPGVIDLFGTGQLSLAGV